MTTRIGGTDLDLDAEARLDEQLGGGLLGRVAVTLSSTLDVNEVLRRLAEMGREASGGQRCSIVLIDGNRLKPAAATTGAPDDDLWGAFRGMPPIELGDEHWHLLRSGRALAIEDARHTPYIPAEWVEQFGLRAVAVVPLVANGEPCGAMAVDWAEVRAIPDDQLATLEAIATYAGLAVHNARLHQRMAGKTRTLEHVVDVAGALNSSSSLDQILEHVCVAFERVLDTTHVSVTLADPADPGHTRTLAARGDGWFTRAGRPVPPEELLPVESIRRSAAGPILYPHLDPPGGHDATTCSARSAALFPLFGPDGVIGAVVTGFSSPVGPAESELEAGQTLAEMAAAAIGRADLHEQLRRRVRQLELLSRLSEVVTGKASLGEVLVGVNEALVPELRTRLDAMVVADDDVRDAVGGAEPDPDERAAIDAWQRDLSAAGPPLGLRPARDRVLVPVTHHRQVLGALRVEVRYEQVALSDEEFLLTIGGAFAEVVHRATLGQALGESERRLAVLLERERIAHDLHDSAGQVLTGMGMKLAGWLDEAPDDTWRHRLTTLLRLARDGERELREAIYSLVFVEVRREGLGRSLQELAGRFGATTGIDVRLRVTGDPASLLPEHEDVLFRVAHEGLSNVERHAEASRVDLDLRYRDHEVVLGVVDDGVGFPDAHRRAGGDDRLRFGLRAIERRVREANGGFTVENAEPGGARLEARIPVDHHAERADAPRSALG